MDPATTIEALAEVIQLSVAPVFLLAGIAGMAIFVGEEKNLNDGEQ